MKLGFIGCGNMARAMIGGIIRGGVTRPEDIIASCRTKEGCERAAAAVPIRVTKDNREVAREADILFLSVKPQFLDGVLEEIRGELRPDQLLVSIAAGRSIDYILKRLGDPDARLVRLMPNTPALVGAGMTAGCGSPSVTAEDMALVTSICETFGAFEQVPESLFDAVTGVSGSSPAYVFMFIEAMADAAVQGGMPRAQAYKFAAQSVMGSARMVTELGRHPGELKDMVTSPGGTTIEAVRVLEKKGMRSAVFEAVRAAAARSEEMGKDKN